MAIDDHDATGDASAPVSRWGRMTGALGNFMLKPPAVDSTKRPDKDAELTEIPDLEAAIKRADDKERLIGLLAAPVAAGIGLLVVGSLVAHDPTGKLHVQPSTYVELGAVTMVLALAMLVTAWLRKRTFLGIAMALYGLSLFNLHYWGFGIPFIIGGSWYLVRSYRLSEKLKLAKADNAPDRTGGPAGARPRPSKRYTPPTTPPRRNPKPGKGLEAG